MIVVEQITKENAVEVAERLWLDRIVYGNSYIQMRGDGTSWRVDPRAVVISDNSIATVPLEPSHDPQTG